MCRLKKNGGPGPVRLASHAPRPPSPDDGWVTLREAAPLFGLKVRTLQTPPWLARLGAVKVGRGWWVSEAALDRLESEPGR